MVDQKTQITWFEHVGDWKLPMIEMKDLQDNNIITMSKSQFQVKVLNKYDVRLDRI